MNILINEEMNFCEEHLNIIKLIVITSACSCIPPTYLEKLKEINKKYQYTQCVTCNSSIFLATNHLYNDYLYTRKAQENVKTAPDNVKNENNINNKATEKEAPKKENKKKTKKS